MQEQGDDGDEAADDGHRIHQAEQGIAQAFGSGGKPVASEGTKRISQMATHRANQKLSCAMPLPTKNVYAKAAVQTAAITQRLAILEQAEAFPDGGAEERRDDHGERREIIADTEPAARPPAGPGR